MHATNTNLNAIINDNNYYIFYDNKNAYLQSSVKKIKINLVSGQPILDDSFVIINYTFDFKDKYLKLLPNQKPFSCEIIDKDKDSRLICGHIRINKTEQNDDLYYFNASLMNSDFNDIEDEINIDIHSSIHYIRLQRKNSNHIKYILTRYSYIITLNKEGDKYKIVSSVDVPSFSEFLCSNDFFFTITVIFFLHIQVPCILKKVQRLII